MGKEIDLEENAILLAKAVSAAGAIEYQADSVVSKTLINKPSGNVTLFAFDAGQGLSEHTAPFDAMVYILDGTANITISGSDQVVKTGEIIIMPAHEPHALKATENFKMMLIMIKS
ncbi:RmlC-like jelly roll fold [Syntrophomonas zehnderi OL-4]|uniref:RmlC-like jelly roll fold n=1 Tax=Syntrophomonas zehnderi OL-4 TaxID=690567 RepID=A0A0E4GDG6_9FIRM|nr:cupin domain-containing protein [Syntrophomonas zehnderi]CFX48234.1 RmlC-like jelly roll fold [Syntrophomonas zehnderi OL-4]